MSKRDRKEKEKREKVNYDESSTGPNARIKMTKCIHALDECKNSHCVAKLIQQAHKTRTQKNIFLNNVHV